MLPIPIHIALVDDHPLFRKGLAELIDGLDGFNVVLEAENGLDLIHQMKSDTKPDIILLDVSMPVMDGIETAGWLSQNYPEIKILIVSMEEDVSIVHQLLKNGIDGYVLKNTDPATIQTALELLITDGNYYAEPINKIIQSISNDKQETVHSLTEREIAFLKLVCTELPYKSFSPILNISPRSVEFIRDTLFKKLNVASRTGLVLYAIKAKIYKPT